MQTSMKRTVIVNVEENCKSILRENFFKNIKNNHALCNVIDALVLRQEYDIAVAIGEHFEYSYRTVFGDNDRFREFYEKNTRKSERLVREYLGINNSLAKSF